MAVEEGSVSFEALSTTRTSKWFSDVVGLGPTVSWEIGGPVGDGSSSRHHKNAGWVLRRDFPGVRAVPGVVEPLDAAISGLLEQLEGRQRALKKVRKHFVLRVRCYGFSDSDQGGFWLSPHVLGALAVLGVEFHCSVYLGYPADGRGVIRAVQRGVLTRWTAET